MLLAYKYVAIAAMLAEINFCARELQLPTKLPIERSQLKVSHVTGPEVDNFGGRLDTVDYSFAFAEDGRLQYIYWVFSPPTAAELGRSRKRPQPTLLSTNQAYQAATNWLRALEYDLRELERTNGLEIYQPIAWDGVRNRGVRPLFIVQWGPRGHLKAEVAVSGRSGRLRYLRLEDTTFSLRPSPLIKNREALLNVPDEDFLALTEKEREAFAKRFLTVPNPTDGSATNAAPKAPLSPPKSIRLRAEDE